MADTIKTTEMATIPVVEESDLLIISKANGSATYKVTIVALAQAILSTFNYQTLDTENKNIISAINELIPEQPEEVEE